MRIHKEGWRTISTSIIVLSAINILTFSLLNLIWLNAAILFFSLVCILFIIRFFRDPIRQVTPNEDFILSPADGKIVAIEECFESEYLQEKCIQLSVFMSGYDVHINWAPISGKVIYFKYHPGKHLFAINPKSSTHNERASTLIENSKGKKVLVRQIAGIMARRIVSYSRNIKQFEQGNELGFIKFGSRVDLFLPLESKILVKLNDSVIGSETVLAKFD